MHGGWGWGQWPAGRRGGLQRSAALSGAGGLQDAVGLRAAPRPAQGQRLLSRRGHHSRLARPGERGLPLPPHQRCGGLLRPHTVGPPRLPAPGCASRPARALTGSAQPFPEHTFAEAWPQRPRVMASSTQAAVVLWRWAALRAHAALPAGSHHLSPQTRMTIQAGEAGQWEPEGSPGVRVTPSSRPPPPGETGQPKGAPLCVCTRG